VRYKDKQWLEEQYENKTQKEIADECGVSRTTITRWMDNHDIEADSRGCSQAEGKHKDEEWLREKYIDEKRSTNDIANECGVGKTTVLYWLDKFNIERRSNQEAVKQSWQDADERREEIGEVFAEANEKLHPFVFTKKSGYVLAGSSDGQGGSELVRIHRLLAAAEYGTDSVRDKVVHHKNGIKWDNRPENIELMDADEHSRHHALESDAEPPRWWEDE